MKKVNIVIGRFQPFTSGHYKCIEAAWKQKHLPTVVCMINTPNSKVDKRHPFPSELLISVYADLFNNDPHIENVVLVSSANIVTIGETLNRLDYQIASWTCGTDRVGDYLRMSTKYHDKANISDDFEVIEVQRSDEDVSATKARNCLLNNDARGFISLLPNGSNSTQFEIYKQLSEQIKYVYSIDKLESRVRYLERLLIH